MPQMIELDFNNQGPKSFDTCEKLFSDLADKVFHHLKLKDDYYVEVNIVDNAFIHQINREYRHIDRPTDVISFAFQDDESEAKLVGQKQISLGTILISHEKAEEQAKEYGHSLLRELSFLFVHGMLHLLGYDHIEKEDEKVMFKLQDEILGGRK